MSIVCVCVCVCVYVCVTVKIQFDNTSTCKYSIIYSSSAWSLCSFVRSDLLFKNSGSAPDCSFEKRVCRGREMTIVTLE